MIDVEKIKRELEEIERENIKKEIERENKKKILPA
jgi:hypothetical protein